MRRHERPRYRVVLAAFLVIVAAVVVGGGSSAFGSGAAAYTTAIDDGSGNPAGCLNGQGINCNNYVTKDDVYVNGGPTNGNGLPAGTYYFSVLVPGYQHDGFIDGHQGNLSDTTSGGTTGDNASGDSFLCRELTVDALGGMTYTPDAGCTTGDHLQGVDVQGSAVTQLMPYDDTSNNGGVYIMAICVVGATSSKDCKFDAFKIASTSTSTADDLTVSKTATPTFTREFPWSITKTACLDGTVVGGTGSLACVTSKTNTSGTAKFNYTVTVTKGTGADSSWDVTGVITVTNPNAFDVTGVNVSDQITYLDNGNATADTNANCQVDGGSDQTIAPNSATDFNYECAYTGAPKSTSETNTPSASWADIGSDNTSANGNPVAISWSTPTSTIHDKVTVGDVITGTVPSTLPSGFIVGAATPNSGLPDGSTEIGVTTTYNYSRTLTVPRNCMTVNNQATFNVTDPDDDPLATPPDTDDTGNATASVQLCRTPANTGALTMGFWQNKNGQGIIHNGGTTGSGPAVCNSGTWLRQFNPFKDLSATATCGAVGSTSSGTVVGYVYNTIKAAQCSSTAKTCNTMLKAQMLATALDVYFSAPAPTFGGNKIGPFDGLGSNQQPVGDFQIDLTQICNMLDGSGGTATCTGAYQNASSVFGGAVCPTVLTMLAYSNTTSATNFPWGTMYVSNSGGTNWYGQNKPDQVLAKNSFDAINNRAAFSCT